MYQPNNFKTLHLQTFLSVRTDAKRVAGTLTNLGVQSHGVVKRI
jgi:hypothetical protein